MPGTVQRPGSARRRWLCQTVQSVQWPGENWKLNIWNLVTVGVFPGICAYLCCNQSYPAELNLQITSSDCLAWSPTALRDTGRKNVAKPMEYVAHGVRGIGWGAKQRPPVGSGTLLEPRWSVDVFPVLCLICCVVFTYHLNFSSMNPNIRQSPGRYSRSTLQNITKLSPRVSDQDL